MIWLGVTRRIAKPLVWQMCLYICIDTNSQPFINTGALVTAIKNYLESREILIGVLKGYSGLSGAVVTGNLCSTGAFRDSGAGAGAGARLGNF